jgi:peptide/nickel transport system substrate-binding protein
MKKFTAIFTALIVLAMLTAACSPTAATEAPVVTEAPAATEAPAVAGTEAPTEEVAPAEPVVLRYASNATPLSSLDRFSSKGVSGDDTGRLWADALLFSDHRGTYAPALAESWTVSEDGLTYTFVLKQGIKFSNGDDFTSADVKKTFERLLEDENLTDAGTWTSSLDHVDAPDDYTAVIVLKALMPTFLDEVDRVPIIDAKVYEADPANYFFSPVGTGAFIVSSFNKDTSEIHFTRNENYWGWTAENKSNVDEIVYQFIKEDTTRASALEAGDVDIATQLTMDYLDTFSSADFNANPLALDRHYAIYFSCADTSVFKDKNLREALSLSIDRQALVDTIYSGGGVVSTFPVPVGNLGYVEGYSYEYNPEHAKELVAASAYKGEEIPLMMTTASLPRANEIAAAMQAMAADAGLFLKIDMVESATYETNRTSGAYQVYLGAFNPTSSDFYKEVAVNLLKDKFQTGCIGKEMKTLAAEAAVTVDRDARAKLYEQIFTIEMTELAPGAYLYTAKFLYPIRSSVSNVTFFTDGTVVLKFAQKN